MFIASSIPWLVISYTYKPKLGSRRSKRATAVESVLWFWSTVSLHKLQRYCYKIANITHACNSNPISWSNVSCLHYVIAIIVEGQQQSKAWTSSFRKSLSHMWNLHDLIDERWIVTVWNHDRAAIESAFFSAFRCWKCNWWTVIQTSPDRLVNKSLCSSFATVISCRE